MKKSKIMLPEMSDYGKLAVILGVIILFLRPIYIWIGYGDPLYVCLIGIATGLPWYLIWNKIEKKNAIVSNDEVRNSKLSRPGVKK